MNGVRFIRNILELDKILDQTITQYFITCYFDEESFSFKTLKVNEAAQKKFDLNSFPTFLRRINLEKDIRERQKVRSFNTKDSQINLEDYLYKQYQSQKEKSNTFLDSDPILKVTYGKQELILRSYSYFLEQITYVLVFNNDSEFETEKLKMEIKEKMSYLQSTIRYFFKSYSTLNQICFQKLSKVYFFDYFQYKLTFGLNQIMNINLHLTQDYKITISKFDLVEVMRKLKQKVSVLEQKKKLVLDYHVPSNLDSAILFNDKQLFIQLFLNLIRILKKNLKKQNIIVDVAQISEKKWKAQQSASIIFQLTLSSYRNQGFDQIFNYNCLEIEVINQILHIIGPLRHPFEVQQFGIQSINLMHRSITSSQNSYLSGYQRHDLININ